MTTDKLKVMADETINNLRNWISECSPELDSNIVDDFAELVLKLATRKLAKQNNS